MVPPKRESIYIRCLVSWETRPHVLVHTWGRQGGVAATNSARFTSFTHACPNQNGRKVRMDRRNTRLCDCCLRAGPVNTYICASSFQSFDSPNVTRTVPPSVAVFSCRKIVGKHGRSVVRASQVVSHLVRVRTILLETYKADNGETESLVFRDVLKAGIWAVEWREV